MAAGWLAHAIAAVAIGLTALAVALGVANRNAAPSPGTGPGDLAGQLVLALMFTTAGWLLAVRRPAVSFGWLALAGGLGHAMAGAGSGWGVFAVTGGRHLAGSGAAMLVTLVGEPLENLVVVGVLTTFPYGRLPTGWLRSLALTSWLLCGAGWVLGLLATVPPTPELPGVANPIAVLPEDMPFPLIFAGGQLLASVVIVVRWLKAVGHERQVLRWLAVVNLAAIALTPAVILLPTGGELIVVLAVAVELVVIVAVVLAHRLYGIETVLNRTLVYVMLLGLVLGLYGAFVAIIAALGQRLAGPWSVAAAIVAALILSPARVRIQRLVNRFLYGNRDEPYAVVTRVADRLEAAGSVQELLPSLLEAITTELRLPHAAVELRMEDDSVRRIVRGGEDPISTVTVRFPLSTGSGDIGALVVGLRRGQAALRQDEARLMQSIAAQVAVAASNVLLTEALLRSRERVVAAGEDERRRLRRDLHDGLGPVLTAAASKVDAVENLFTKNASMALDVLQSVRADLSVALEDLRRLVYALHPPILDELGLLESLRQQLPRMSVPVTLCVPDALPDLPRQVELAAYRIVTEAVTNVARHATASSCTVSIEYDDRLRLQIRDDGINRAQWQPGLGLTSMRERVTALGGTCLAGPTPWGGQVIVELPMTRAEVTA
jgi:signal transduction histidine kinase